MAAFGREPTTLAVEVTMHRGEVPLRHVRRASIAIVYMLSSSACSEDSVSGPRIGPSPNEAVTTIRPEYPRPKTLDERWADLVEEIPGFAGYFVDASGVTTIALVDRSQGDLAKAVLTPILRDRQVPIADVRIVAARYDFRELNAWKRLARDILNLPGVTMLDADEVRNRVAVGVASQDVRTRVEQEVARIGIPREAVLIEVAAPFRLTEGLHDPIRPIFGGQAVRYSAPYVVWNPCTHGINVRLPSDPLGTQEYFLTNSHCTNGSGGFDGQVNGATYALPTDGYTFGQEVDDAPMLTNATEPLCPTGNYCRWSDAARGRHFQAVDSRFGFIAHTTGFGSTTLLASNPYFQITTVIGDGGTAGQQADKVGAGLGWTSGPIQNTCLDVPFQNLYGDSLTLICQHVAGASADPGDSGSPVFRVTGSSTVALLGILWGARADNSAFAYSEWDWITLELGNLIARP